MAPSALAQSEDGAWQSSLEVIKQRVQALIDKNNELTVQYQGSLQKERDLRHTIDEQSQKNEDIKRFLKERNGKTDEQVRLQELAAETRAKQAMVAPLQRQADSLRKERLKIAGPVKEEPAEQASDAAAAPDESELAGLRADLESQKAQEAALEKQLPANALKDPKVLAEEITQTGVYNKQARSRIKDMRQDVALMKEQVFTLETRMSKKGGSNGKSKQ